MAQYSSSHPPNNNPTADWPQPKPPFSTTHEPITNCLHTPTAISLCSDFSMADLNDIHHHLWMAGSYGNISALHHQRVILRNIVPCELSRLHLVWFGRTIYVKPLPDCLLSTEYYADVVCKDVDLYGLIIGFLRSYCSLIQFPVDLAIAHEAHLISKDVKWHQWAILREAILSETDLSNFNERYKYGELRLHRLDLIYRFTGRGLTYFTVHRTYETYFRDNITLFGTAFGFLAVILTAMQVLVSISPIPTALVTICYRFSVAVLVLICVCFGYIGLVFCSLFLYNYVVTLVAQAKS